MSSNNVSRRRFLQTAAVGTAAIAAPKFGFAAPGGTIRVHTYGDLQVLDPAFMISAPENMLYDLIYHRLVVYKGSDSTEIENDAAESIEQVDDTHIRFTLKKGLKWSGDFGEVTAEDVKFSFERIADPAMESPYAGDWSTLDHVEVTDTYSGVIVLKEYYAPLWTNTLPGNSGCIVCEKAVEALPEKKYTTEVPAHSGPYSLTEWTPKQQIVFTPNPSWTGAPQAFDEIRVIPIEDTARAELAFQAGDLDFSLLTLSTLGQYRSAGAPAGTKIIDMPSLAYVWLGMNIENPALSDIRVRKAIQRAVDVPAVVEAAYFGVAVPSTGIIADTLPGHRASAVTRDLEEARRLLDEAGVSGLSLTLDCGVDTQSVTAAQIIQASLAETGIEVTINQRDSATFWTLGDESAGEQWKDVQLILNRFTMTPDPFYATEWFTCAQVGVWNWERFCNPEFDRLHAAALREKDLQKRAEMYVRMQDLMEDSGAYVFLTHERVGFIYRDSFVCSAKPSGEPLIARFRPA